MKKLFFIALIAGILLGLFIQPLSSKFFNTKKIYSILGPDKDALIESATSQKKEIVVSQEQYILDIPTTTTAGTAGKELAAFVENSNFFKYSPNRWRKLMQQLNNPAQSIEETTLISSGTKKLPPPIPPGLTVELPYESQLSISGRKTIGVTFSSTMYDKPDSQKRINSSSLAMKQELQVRINGKVGRKVNVNVDFDDTTADKRDISVVYKGDPDEVIQEAAFGDISMTLPATEFVGYSKQLFGIKVDAKPTKNLRTIGFFSRTKGLSEVKRFTGNTTLNRRLIADNSYISYKYYNLVLNGSYKIKSGTAKIYKDDRNIVNNNVTTSTNTTVDIIPLTGATTNYIGDFDLLVPGQDYTIDYDRGIIAFRNRLEANWVIAVDYQKDDNTWLSADTGRWKVIKDGNNNVNYTRELKTFYSLGNLKIIRDNGRGNFILQVQDLNNTQVTTIDNGSTQKTVPYYPQNITVDFDNGIFNFEPPTGKPFHDDLYTSNTHKYNILTEYSYRNKILTLRPGIVPQSEHVTLNGKTLQKDSDYYLDYDAGIITFYNEDNIKEDSVIEISYDYAPFGNAGGDTLIGLRSELSLTKNISVGSSFIYDFAAQSTVVPDIRTTPSSLQVLEGDAKISDIDIPGIGVKASIAGEYASSERNPNVMNKAILESMESIKTEDSASLNYQNWQLASNPSGLKYFSNAITVSNEDISKTEINPNLVLKTDEKQSVLDLNYNLTNSNETSIVQVLSKVGNDYSKKQFLEFWLQGDGKGAQFLVGYGSFNEDVDGSGVLKTEDLNHDGTLNFGEDIGWNFINPDNTSTPIGANNSLLDTEDLNGDGVLNNFDTVVSQFGAAQNNYSKILIDVDGNTYNSVTWTGWKHFVIPLNITATQLTDWQVIKQVRITLRSSGNNESGTLKLAKLSVSGNRWEQGTNSSVIGATLTISAKNTNDDIDYKNNSLLTNPDYLNLYDIANQDLTNYTEQALALNYSISTSSNVDLSARLPYSTAYDLSNYHNLKLFVYAKTVNVGDVFYIQAGNDTNYLEYTIPITWTGWKLLNIEQIDTNGDTKPDLWQTTYPASSTTVVGLPSLQNITQIKLGIRTTAGTKSGEIWVDEIHMTEAWLKEGYAWRTNADFLVPEWATFGGKRKQVTRNFESFSAGIYNRDLTEDSAYFNLMKIPLMPISMPINTALSRSVILTPSVIENQSDLVSILNEGKILSYSGSGGTSFSLGTNLPSFSGNYTRAINDSSQLNRIQDDETLTGNASYSLPVRFIVLPTGISANYSITNSFLRPWQEIKGSTDTAFLGLDAFKEYLKLTNYNSLDITETWSGKTPFQFFNGFNFTPNYTLTKVKEKNHLINWEFNKSANQTFGATSNLSFASWFCPSLTYSISTNENYNIAYNTTTAPAVYPGNVKLIERASNAEVALNFNMREVTNFKFTRSLGFYSNYKIQDNDSYNNVPATYTAIGFDNLWVRNSPLELDTTNYAYLKSELHRDDVRLNCAYNPFEALNFSGRLSPLNLLSTNFTYTGTREQSWVTGTLKEVVTRVWPDLTITMKNWEKFFFIERWVSDSQWNINFRDKYTETIDVSNNTDKTFGTNFAFYLVKKIDLNIGANVIDDKDFDFINNVITRKAQNITWSTQSGYTYKQWRFGLRYENGQSWQRDGTEKLTQQLLTNIYTAQTNLDISFPNGLPIPFTKKTLPLTNRMILSSTLKYTTTNSSLNVEIDNKNIYSLNLSADYEISQNFRTTIGIGYSKTENRVVPDDNYQTIEASGRLTIQF